MKNHSKIALIKYLLVIIILTAILAPALSATAAVTNGSFETGDLTGWSTVEKSSASVFAWDGIFGPTDCRTWLPSNGLTDGSFATLMTTNGPGTGELYQDFVVSEDILSLDITYTNLLNTWNSFQRLLVAIVDPASPSTRYVTILEGVEGVTPYSADKLHLSADLSAYNGQTVRLLISVVANGSCLATVVDNVQFSIPISNDYSKIEQVRVTAPGTALYDDAAGDVIRDASHAEIWVPNATADNPFEDVYDVVASMDVDGTTWVQIFVGNANAMPWIPLNGTSVTVITP